MFSNLQFAVHANTHVSVEQESHGKVETHPSNGENEHHFGPETEMRFVCDSFLFLVPVERWVAVFVAVVNLG